MKTKLTVGKEYKIKVPHVDDEIVNAKITNIKGSIINYILVDDENSGGMCYEEEFLKAIENAKE